MDDYGVMVFFAGKNDWLKKLPAYLFGCKSPLFPRMFFEVVFRWKFLAAKIVIVLFVGLTEVSAKVLAAFSASQIG